MKIYKIIFASSMIMGTMLAISSYSWLSMWMGLEINLLSVIPLLIDKKNVLSSESSMKYFITQALASMILLSSVLLLLLTEEFINPLMNFNLSMMLNTAILTKLGAAPFHFWLPEVIEGLSWSNSLIMLIVQKIAPMMILMNLEINQTFLVSVIILSLLISTISGFNQVSLRKLLAFSSINHVAWMLIALFLSFDLWLTYFVIYSIINVNIMFLFKKTKTFYMNQIPGIMNNSKLFKFTLMTNFLSLGGLPPFLGFIPKWFTIKYMTNNNMMMLAFIMIITTLIMLFIYTQIIMSSLVLNSSEPKTKTIKFKSEYLIMMNAANLMGMIACILLLDLP